MKQSKKEGVKFENWKSGKTIVQRDSKGRFISKLPQKGSGIRTKQQAYQRIKTSGTLRKDTARVSRRNPSIENGKISKITIKGTKKSKTIRVKRAKLRKAQQIGKNTAILKTKKPISSQQYYQYVARVKWGDKQIETIGYSDVRGNPKQAILRARQGAIMKRLISYDHELRFETKDSGVAYKPNDIVYFKSDLEVQTYVRVDESFPTIKA